MSNARMRLYANWLRFSIVQYQSASTMYTEIVLWSTSGGPLVPAFFRPGHSWLVYFRVPPNAGTWELGLGWAGLGGRAWEPSQEVKRGVRVATLHYTIDVCTYVYRT